MCLIRPETVNTTSKTIRAFRRQNYFLTDRLLTDHSEHPKPMKFYEVV